MSWERYPRVVKYAEQLRSHWFKGLGGNHISFWGFTTYIGSTQISTTTRGKFVRLRIDHAGIGEAAALHKVKQKVRRHLCSIKSARPFRPWWFNVKGLPMITTAHFNMGTVTKYCSDKYLFERDDGTYALGRVAINPNFRSKNILIDMGQHGTRLIDAFGFNFTQKYVKPNSEYMYRRYIKKDGSIPFKNKRRLTNGNNIQLPTTMQ